MLIKIIIPESKEESLKIKKSIESDLMNSSKVKTEIKLNKNLEIIINGEDISNVRAAVNSALKAYKLNKEVRKCLMKINKN